MINISRFLITSKQLINLRLSRFSGLLSISSKAFAAKNKDGAGQSDKEVDKSKKTVKSVNAAEPEKKTAAPKQETASETPKQAQAGTVRVIESIPGDRVIFFLIILLNVTNTAENLNKKKFFIYLMGHLIN